MKFPTSFHQNLRESKYSICSVFTLFLSDSNRSAEETDFQIITMNCRPAKTQIFCCLLCGQHCGSPFLWSEHLMHHKIDLQGMHTDHTVGPTVGLVPHNAILERRRNTPEATSTAATNIARPLIFRSVETFLQDAGSTGTGKLNPRTQNWDIRLIALSQKRKASGPLELPTARRADKFSQYSQLQCQVHKSSSCWKRNAPVKQISGETQNKVCKLSWCLGTKGDNTKGPSKRMFGWIQRVKEVRLRSMNWSVQKKPALIPSRHVSRFSSISGFSV